MAHWIATCGPLGASHFAPGTLGSLAAVPLILIVGENLTFFVFIVLALTAVAVWASHTVSQDLADPDPPSVVIDEVCGMMASLLFLPIKWQTLAAGFLAFRFFDIVKPPPIRSLERLPLGFGIVFDDIAAGIYTNLILQVLVHYAHL